MRFSSVRDKTIGLLVIIVSLSTLGHAFKAIQPGSDNADDKWYTTISADWASDSQNRVGVKLKAYEQRHMNVDEARALCRKHGAKLAVTGDMIAARFNALYRFEAWVDGKQKGECRVARANDGFVDSNDNCGARPDFAICEKPAD
ncbi:hypothetical protein Q1695_014186 [Nippostrongylus brasiliensis]|nr:hypothetical protein Q1695_014186 [Nippostrongylus brasiliensis]